LPAVAVLASFLVGGAAALPGVANATDAGDPIRGKAVFADRCLRCHTYPSDFALTADDLAADAGSRGKEGTPLAGLIRRKAGTLPDYFYSDAMLAADVVWTAETLRDFIQSPRTFIRYNRMGFSGVQDEGDVDDLVAYLHEAAKPAGE